MENLKWLVFNTRCGDVSGDCPEDLNRILLAGQELAKLEKVMDLLSEFGVSDAEELDAFLSENLDGG